MKKILLILSFTIITLNAGLINSIALLVNNEPITSIDIDNKMQETGSNKQAAVNVLVEEMLYTQSLEKLNISVGTYDINNYIEKLAAQNKMKVFEFKNAIKQQQNYDQFISEIKRNITHQKLVSKVAANKIAIANDEDMQIYFKNNIHEFNKASKIDVRVYISKNKQILSSLQKNPMMSSKEVVIQNVTLESAQVNPKISYILSKTAQGSFSSIFVNNKAYNMFYVIKKYDIKVISFDEAKNTIFEKMMQKRQEEYLRDYFETLKITAKIKVLQ